jgi:hypothetical protein
MNEDDRKKLLQIKDFFFSIEDVSPLAAIGLDLLGHTDWLIQKLELEADLVKEKQELAKIVRKDIIDMIRSRLVSSVGMTSVEVIANSHRLACSMECEKIIELIEKMGKDHP